MEQQRSRDSQEKILSSAIDVIRSQGYASATVADVCDRAGVTKGSFFHHYGSKDEMTLAAVDLWSRRAESLFASAPYHDLEDPFDRLLGYIDFRRQLVRGELAEYTCLLGTLAQEVHETHADIREACDQGIGEHINVLAVEIEAAREKYCPNARWSSASVARFIQTVLQGSFVLAKMTQSPEAALEALDHLERYFTSLFEGPRGGPILEPINS